VYIRSFQIIRQEHDKSRFHERHSKLQSTKYYLTFGSVHATSPKSLYIARTLCN